MNNPISHHYSPQFYLRQWTGPDGRVARYHRPHDRVVVSRRSPEHTGFEDYLYSVEGQSDPQILEKGFFQKVDSDAAPLLQEMCQLGPGLVIVDGRFGSEERSNWTRFINSLSLRGPHSMGEIETAC
jgi:hypothetical protein